MKSARRSSGFTLVEVMVALAVVAVALPALLMAQYQQVDATGYLRDKAMARLVASNLLTEMRLAARAQDGLFFGEASGEAELAERLWYWEIQTEQTELPGFFRFEIAVFDEEEQEDGQDSPLYTLVAFMHSTEEDTDA